MSKIDELDKKLDQVTDIEKHLEKIIDRQEEEINKIESEEKEIQRSVFKIGNFTFRKGHLMEFAKGVAGAFLGVGLGEALGTSETLAAGLPWLNIFGILIFIFIVVGFLIYEKDKDQIWGTGKKAYIYVTKKLILLYSVSLIVEVCSLFLFNDFPGWNMLLVKTLIIGSYLVMSSAAAFTLI